MHPTWRMEFGGRTQFAPTRETKMRWDLGGQRNCPQFDFKAEFLRFNPYCAFLSQLFSRVHANRPLCYAMRYVSLNRSNSFLQ